MEIIRVKTILARTGLSRSAFYRLAAAGAFGKKVRLGPNTVGYESSAVVLWLSQLRRE